MTDNEVVSAGVRQIPQLPCAANAHDAITLIHVIHVIVHACARVHRKHNADATSVAITAQHSRR